MKGFFHHSTEDLTLGKLDRWLEIFCVLLLLPLALTLWFEAEPFDLLAYLSFVMTVWSAVYAGRGIFAGQGTNKKSKAASDLIAKKSYLLSLFFVSIAAVLLIPTVFRKADGMVPGCLTLATGMFAVAIALSSISKGFQTAQFFAWRVWILPIGLTVVVTGGGWASFHYWPELAARRLPPLPLKTLPPAMKTLPPAKSIDRERASGSTDGRSS